jgi:hypothetical protein
MADHARIQSRIAEGKPVGRLIDQAQAEGEDVSGYYPQRTTEDVAAEARWYAYNGQTAVDAINELERRASS